MADSPSIVIRAVWFVFVGSWLTAIVLGVAWVLNVTIIGLPAGIKLINKAPYLLTLKKSESSGSGQTIEMGGSSSDSPGLVVRGIYFFAIGWWASGILMTIAYVLSLSVIGLPLGVKAFNYLPYVTSLKSS